MNALPAIPLINGASPQKARPNCARNAIKNTLWVPFPENSFRHSDTIPACSETTTLNIYYAYERIDTEQVRLSADYWFSDSEEDITFTTGALLTAVDIPKLKTRTLNARLTGRYRWSNHVDVSLRLYV